jgi:predicted GNAT superfamily acetyltransferase
VTSTIRDLHTLDDCRRIVELEKTIWGYTEPEDLVPAIMLFLSAKRGGMLIAAEREDGTLEGFAFSMASIVDGKPAQWSHMMGVVPGCREAGLGRRLKLAQRDRALAMGIELIEWTFDPLQAVNAHLNFAKLGAIATTYAVNIYGDSSSALHRGTPTDRLIAEWWIQRPHVERRIAAGAEGRTIPLLARDSRVTQAPVLNPPSSTDPWHTPAASALALEGPRVLIRVPARFTEMQAAEPSLALAWRLQTRELFMSAFARGYRAVDFLRDEQNGGGAYLLALPDEGTKA